MTGSKVKVAKLDTTSTTDKDEDTVLEDVVDELILKQEPLETPPELTSVPAAESGVDVSGFTADQAPIEEDGGGDGGDGALSGTVVCHVCRLVLPDKTSRQINYGV